MGVPMVERDEMHSSVNLYEERLVRARFIADAGGLNNAIQSGVIPRVIDTTLSEALILGLLRQNVTTYFAVFGHGSTELAEVLRIYQQVGLVRVLAVRSEIEASHAASALRWMRGEKSAVITSIGPGALHALAASLVPASDGIGVWYLLGDETSEDEGPNMQQIPGNEQHGFLKLYSHMGAAYSLHTPLALPTALQRGLNTVDHPHKGGPFFLLLPLNTQNARLTDFNTDELPQGTPPALGAASGSVIYTEAVNRILTARRVVIKAGGGARGAGQQILRFMELIGGVTVTSPLVSGLIPYDHPRNMTVGGSKGSISGNYAMEHADLLVAIGTRFVCQSDCSRTAYPGVQHVININTDPHAVNHYGKTTSLLGDAAATLDQLNALLEKSITNRDVSAWLRETASQKESWKKFKQVRYDHPTLYDEVWKRDVLTQPAAIKTATDWARKNGAISIFDAGDVQANGFQVVEDDRLGQSFTDTGASYMGFAVSALLASAASQTPFYGLAISGDGSFTMNPQILIDGVEHKVHGCILLLDNRRMSAISNLQMDQYGTSFATNDSVAVDYVAWANAIDGVNGLHGGYDISTLIQSLDKAKAYPGLSLIHVPVYFGPDPLGGLGVYGRWNVGNWTDATQKLRHQIGL